MFPDIKLAFPFCRNTKPNEPKVEKTEVFLPSKVNE